MRIYRKSFKRKSSVGSWIIVQKEARDGEKNGRGTNVHDKIRVSAHWVSYCLYPRKNLKAPHSKVTTELEGRR